MGKRVVVLGLDGVPFTFLKKLFSEGKMPYLKSLTEKGSFSQMDSVFPPVSSCAWSSFMTGKNPGGHNIFGFVDKNKNNSLYIPTSENMTSKTLWEILSDNGKKVVVMNVPVTYPPRDVNGILIGCFLCPNIEKITNDKVILNYLKAVGYKIDADASIAKNESKEKFMEEIYDAFEKRKKVMFTLMEKKQWDFFMCHIMETDRLNHFFWGEMEDKHPLFYKKYMEFMQKIDDLIKEVKNKLDQNTELILLSDHGFCKVKCEYEINHWLKEKGYLVLYEDRNKEMLHKIDFTKTKALSLIPGRFYITNNKNNKEKHKEIRNQLTQDLKELKDDDGTKIIQIIENKENIFSGISYENAPDLTVIPTNGYDLKGQIDSNQRKITGGLITGMHTFEDSFFYMDTKTQIYRKGFNIGDLMPTILDIMEIPKPSDLSCKSIKNPPKSI